MLDRLRRRMLPLPLSRGLQIVAGIASADATSNWYKTALNHFIKYYGDIPASSVTPEMVKAWSESLYSYQNPISKKHMAAHSMNGYRRAVRAFFNHLERLELIKESPTKNFTFPEPPTLEPKHLSEPDAMAIVRMAESLRDQLMMQLLYDSGCRIGELVSIRVSSTVIEKVPPPHLTDDQRYFVMLANEYGLQDMIKDEYLYVFRGKSRVVGKGQNGRRKERTIFFSHSTCVTYHKYLDTRPWNAPDILFLRHNLPAPVTKQSLYHAFKKLAVKAGVEASPHSFRHTFAYRVLRIFKRDPRIAQQMLGHEDVLTTLRIYYGLKEEELWEAYGEMTDANLPSKEEKPQGQSNGIDPASSWSELFEY